MFTLNPINKLSLYDLDGNQSYKSAAIEFIAMIAQGFLTYQIIRGFRKFSMK